MSKPYCGARKVLKNRVRGTSEQCIKSGQARYYGIMSVENEINKILAEKRNLANEKAKIKRQKAKNSTTEANNLIKKTNVAARKAKKDQLEAKKAVNEVKKTTANNKIKLRRATTSTKKIKPINISNNEILKAISTQKRGRKK